MFRVSTLFGRVLVVLSGITPLSSRSGAKLEVEQSGEPLSLLATAHALVWINLPASSSKCNPHAERFVRAVRSECLEHFVVFRERHLREYVEHYNTERYHQGLTQAREAPSNDKRERDAIASRSRLGGLLNFYFNQAA